MVSSPVARRRRRFRLSPSGAAVGTLTLLAAALYSTFALYRFYQFNSATYDLVIFDQAVDSYAHFQPGISIVKGLHNGFGPHFSVLGDHFSPIIATLAPLYWIHNGPQDLLLAQSVLFALAIPPIWIFVRRAMGGGRRGTVAAYLASIAYGLSWPIAAAVAFDFHEVAFAPALTAVALERLQVGKVRTALVAIGALLLVKEDMGLMVAGLGAVLLVSRQHLSRQRMLGAWLIVAGLVAMVISIYVIIPAMGGRSDYYFAYSAFGTSTPQALLHMVEHPLRALHELVTPRTKLDTMIWLFGAFAFLPLLSPITIAAVPLLLERMLANTSPNWWGVAFQYNAFLVVILLLAAVDGGIRLGRGVSWARGYRAARAAGRPAPLLGAEPAGSSPRLAGAAAGAAAAAAPAAAAVSISAGSPAAPPAPAPGAPGGPPPGITGAETGGRPRELGIASALAGNVAVAAAGLIFAMAILFVPKSAFDGMLQPGFFDAVNRATQAESAAVAAVPSGVTVATANMLGPHLVTRDTVVLWDGDGSTPPTFAPWVIANNSEVQFTFSSIAEQNKSIHFLESHGYKVVFLRNGYYVLHRGDLPARRRGHEEAAR
jgi:uncharacterized membrane protein